MQRPGSTVDRRSLVLALAASCALAACKPVDKPSFVGADITGAPYARDFSLTDVDGQTRTLADFKGQVVVVFFGFTQCPDVCPSTLGELALVKQELGDAGRRVRPIFITVDPERDSAPILKAYMANFGADGVALRGTPEQTAAVAKEFKVFFAKVPGKTPDSYTVDHTAASFLFDAQGRVRVYSRYGSGPQALKADLQQLLKEAS
jgi:protein SCO1